MDTASLELCKELYELSHWTLTEKHWYQGKPIYNSPWGWQCSAYDLGFLLRKLPRMGAVSVTSIIGAQWEAVYYGNRGDLCYEKRCQADTPEDAACKLVIELFQQGILVPSF